MALAKAESGAQLLARLTTARADISKLDPLLCPWGYRAENIVELIGEEGSGKTELLLHLAANCILPESWKSIQLGGISAGLLFVDTDFHFSIIRLTSILEARIKEAASSKESNPKHVDICEEEIENCVQLCLGRLFIVQCSSSNQLLITLYSLEAILNNKPEISVLMIDSISAFYWTDRLSGGDSVATQEACLKQIAQVLRKIVKEHNLVLFASTAALFNKRTRNQEGDDAYGGANRHFEPDTTNQPPEYNQYLCKDWQRMVTNRLTLYRIIAPDSKLFYRVTHESKSNGSLQKKFIISNSGFCETCL